MRVPKTSSGKIRRAATRELYEAGKLGRPDRALRWQLVRLAAAGAAGRLAQWVRTAADFAYAAWWWTALMLSPRWSGRWSSSCRGADGGMPRSRLGARALFALTGIRFTTDADAPVPDRDVVIVVNHTSSSRRRGGLGGDPPGR